MSVRLFYTPGRDFNLLAAALDVQSMRSIKKTEVLHAKDKPYERCNYMITGRQLNRDTSLYATLVGATAVVLPEAGPWLAEKIRNALIAEADLVLTTYEVGQVSFR